MLKKYKKIKKEEEMQKKTLDRLFCINRNGYK